MNPFSRSYGVLPALFFSFFLSSSLFLSAQEQLGMRFDCSAGLFGAALNPAQTAFMPHPWEVTLFTAEGFFENNYGYLRNTGVFKIPGRLDDYLAVVDTFHYSGPLSNENLPFGFYNDRPTIRGIFQGRLSGPGAAVRIGDKHVIGLVSALRAEASGYGLPGFLRARSLQDRQRHQMDEVTPVLGGVLSWGEIGLHYSYLFEGDALTIGFGVTPKLLLGMEAAFARSNSNLGFCSTLRDSMAFSEGDWELAMTTGNLDAVSNMGAAGQLDMQQISPKINGLGASLDLGVVIAMPTYDNGNAEEYDWRVGISLIDFGMVRFKQQSEYHQFVFDSTRVISSVAYASERDAHSLMEMADMSFYGEAGSSMRAQRFSAFLPSALALQFDYRLTPEVYVGSVLVQRISFGKFAIKRSNTFSILPRYERRRLSVSAPLSLNDWQSVRFGFAFRLGCFTLGSDNLGSFFRQKEFTGSDIYMGVKINGWETGFRDGMSRRSKRKIKCFNF